MFTPHDGGIVGVVQMQPGNWAVFAPSAGNPFDAQDALSAAARFLCSHGAAHDVHGALFAYNRADWYVDRSAAGAACTPPSLVQPSKTATPGADGSPGTAAAPR